MEEFILQEDEIKDISYLSNNSREGARLIFWGLVRDHNLGYKDISKIEYSCYHELAIREGRKILGEAREKFSILRIHCIHRIGMLMVQERVVRVEIGAEHREASYHACMYVMEEIKKRLPIWKKEFSLAHGGRWIDG